MFARATMMLLSGAIGMTLTGCSATSPTMRAQSPNAAFASYDGGWDGCESGMSCDCQNGECDAGGGRRASRRQARQAGAPVVTGACPTGQCPDGKCGGRCLNIPFHPVHRNFHSYEVPRGLSRPDTSAPPASYQYPYYTTRGPTDFFMK
ncbi:hypothetical protein [Fuerstiella marisgermanici]|uniref:Lipoprotein n=1 Tax=Fuerstiella marisgermanici TaxID=1891926 RepID=A0A1P8WB36_9PLAN|nr:hypothetical protein [Fuerstiella marisgermanici]APZ91246.1 hypothetical protein Fuma_00832 [Fuerstiella marisgermanici]